MYSVEEVSEKLNVSKVTVYSKLKKYDGMVVLKQGKKYVTDELLSLIKSELNLSNKLKDDLKVKDIENGDTQDISMDKDRLIKLNSSLYESLIKQLDEKDRQIAEMQNTINELVNLNKNNQVLLKNQQDKDQLKLEEHFEEIDYKLQNLKQKMEEKQKVKKCFCSFFKK